MAHHLGRGRRRPHLVSPGVKIVFTSHGLPRTPDLPSGDAFAVQQRGHSLIAVLADGVGGARDGTAAAEKSVRLITENYLARPQAWTPSKALREFTQQINRQLHQESLQRFDRPEMLCTVAALALENNTVNGLNIGDSPIYVWRGGRLQRLSQDHVHDDPAMSHVLTRALGLEADAAPHEFAWSPEPGDVLLLCSDGVSNVLGETTMAELLSRRASARGIISVASEAAEDNEADDLSAIVIEIIAFEDTDPAHTRPLETIATPKAGAMVAGFKLTRSLNPNDRVWLATAADGTQHVFKLVPPEAREDDAIAAAFVREAWNATRFGKSEFFPTAHIPAGDACYGYAQEFVDAPSLRTVLRQRALTVEEAVALGHFLIRAQSFLLRNDLAHGDIKPENILVRSTGVSATKYLLLDLGSAVEIFHHPGRAGTASYLAPERFTGAPVTERTEIFSIGVTLFEALCRRYPYGEIERFQTPTYGTPKRPATLNAAIPEWLNSVILRALSPQPEDRQQNYSEILFELEHPDQVQPFHRKGAPLLERNPAAFFRAAFLISAVLNLLLLARCHAG